MNFIAIDFETANADRASICQFGVTKVEQGNLISTRCGFVDCEMAFAPINVQIHGINEDKVHGQPKLYEVLVPLLKDLAGSFVICHSAFDRVALTRSAQNCNLEMPEIFWLDSMRIARQNWPHLFGKSGYGLANIAKTLDIEFGHHDAGEDSRAAAIIVIRSIEESGMSLEQWHVAMSRKNRPHLPKLLIQLQRLMPRLRAIHWFSRAH